MWGITFRFWILVEGFLEQEKIYSKRYLNVICNQVNVFMRLLVVHCYQRVAGYVFL